jgi:hypothetical protein
VSNLTRQIICLVEAALKKTDWMERHGDDRIGCRQQVAVCPPHQLGQRNRELSMTLELECVHQFAQRTVEPARTARD